MESSPKINKDHLDYVKNKIEGPEYIRFDNSKYLKPLFKYNPYNESGNIKGLVGNLEISLDYIKDDRKISYPNIRKLKELILRNPEAELDILKLLPPEYSVYFTTNMDKEDYSFEGVNAPKEKRMYINTPLLSIDGILGILHEIGHNVRDEQQSPSEQTKDEVSNLRFMLEEIMEKILAGISPRKPNIEDASRLLQDERDAWGIALNKIKPFMKDLNIDTEDLKNIIHHNALYSYSLLIKEEINLEK